MHGIAYLTIIMCSTKIRINNMPKVWETFVLIQFPWLYNGMEYTNKFAGDDIVGNACCNILIVTVHNRSGIAWIRCLDN